MRHVCGILIKHDEVVPPHIAAEAKALTISYLRWGYFGDIIEGTSVDEILAKASRAGYDSCFIQGVGHIVPDRWSPKQDATSEFFHQLRRFLESSDFLVAGEISPSGENGCGLLSRWLVVNLAIHRDLGSPRFDTVLEGSGFIEASRNHGLPVKDLDPQIRGLMLDLGPGLTEHREFLQALARRSSDTSRSVFAWNFESYDDVMVRPQAWQGPVSTLYGVAAGLKPSMILKTHGYNEDTNVVLFDISRAALEFQKFLHEEWDGRDYPRFLKRVLHHLPADTYYYLWPGASLEDADSPEMQRVWGAEVERWGGEEELRRHWMGTRALKHTYLECNLLEEPGRLLAEIEDDPSAVVWWSNVYHTAYTTCRYTVEEKRAVYESWIDSLAERAPQVLVYGSDHSNSSVNGMNASEYRAAYMSVGGDPLSERRLHRRAIRF